MINRRELEREFRKELVVKVAGELFREESFEKVTVEDIARKSQLGKASLYQLFSSKEEILVEVLCQALKDLSFSLQAECQGLKGKEALKKAVELQYDFYYVYNSLFLSMVRRIWDGDLDSDFLQRIREHNEKKNRTLLRILTAVEGEGIVLARRPEDLIPLLEHILRGMALGRRQNRIPVLEDKEAINEIILYGFVREEKSCE